MKEFKKAKIANEAILKMIPDFKMSIIKNEGKISGDTFVDDEVKISDILLSLLVYVENTILNNDNEFTFQELAQLSMQCLSIATACEKKGEN